MTRKSLILTSLILGTVAVTACKTTSELNDSRDPAAVNPRRGSPAEYDPGPAPDSEWARLFASTPNYRGIGEKLLGSADKFRWIFGPMWYRGRLEPNEVKVFVVGQEGAQDENVTNRAFTGSTGTKTQKFLNHLGIRSSYLFLNTFVYTINGQLSDDPKFKWMEQHVDSPIVQYRHKLFDHMAKTNTDSLALIIGVGTGGKASVVTWVKANGGTCSTANNIANCDTSKVEQKFGLKKKLLVIGVPHPGGANPNLGGEAQLQNIIRGFSRAAARVGDRIQQNEGWLPVDAGMQRGNLNATYRYGNAPVPHRDFAFGTNWRMGASGTSSNRRGADSIQIFSDEGEYNPPSNLFRYSPSRLPDVVNSSANPIPEMPAGDLPYESPRKNYKDFDAGPCGGTQYVCELSKLLQGQLPGYEWPDFAALGVTSHESFGHGPIYRGRLNDARVLVIADQTSHDDLFSTRALTGEAGQRLQAYLRSMGITKSYAIIRTAPVDTLDLQGAAREKVLLDPQVTKVRNKIIDTVLAQGKTKIVIALGEYAQRIVADNASLATLKRYNLDLPSGTSHVAKWNSEMKEIRKAKVKPDVAGVVPAYKGEVLAIPRYDLPVHTRWWMGTSGDRAGRPINNASGTPDPHHYKVEAPKWVAQKYRKPAPYTAAFNLSGLGSVSDESGTEDAEEVSAEPAESQANSDE